MENKELNIHVQKESPTIEILKGEALPRREPLKVTVEGLINTPFDYLKKRHNEIDIKKSHLIVNISDGSIELVVNEKDHYCDTIYGKLKLNPDYTNFGINTGKSRDTFELANFIKMNRFFFDDKNTAMKIVSELKNFKAKVNREFENSDNDRGNTKLSKSQVVESNIPEAFDIVVPIFKGQNENKFRVEINIDARDFSCVLISPDAKDLINETKSNLINEVIANISQLTPDLAILNI